MVYSREDGGFRQRLRQRFDRLRSESRNRDPVHSASTLSPQHAQADPFIVNGQGLCRDPSTDTDLVSSSSSISQSAVLTAGPLPLNQAKDIIGESINNKNEDTQSDQRTLHLNISERNFTTDQSALRNSVASAIGSSDLWSAAYREAVESFKEMDIAVLEGQSVAQLFQSLEDIEKEATHESAFSRGVKYLRSIQVPLERFKLALDLASPLANIEPTATTVVGVVRSVTAIAITFATADLDFANQIADMLEQISYIDSCDTLGQKVDNKDIHKALVSVYRKILEFYKAAYEILSEKGAKLVLKMVLEGDRLPNIVQDFLRCSDTLRKLVGSAILEITEDLKNMVYDIEIDRWLGSDNMSRQSVYHSDCQKLRASEACKVLLENTHFLDWYHHSKSQQLAVLGEMGCGKTVAMSSVIDYLIRENKYQIPQPKVCWYYCRDDETGRATAIFSALLRSLLGQLPGLKKPFVEWYKQAQASGFPDPAKNVQRLEGFLQDALEATDRPVFIVIDGLDECSKGARDSLLKSLKSLSQRVPGLKTILSSRPNEGVLHQLDGMDLIKLVSDAHRDRIIVENTVEKHLSYLSTNVKALLVDGLSRLAQGNGIWTRMTIQLIELRYLTTEKSIQRFLRETPLPTELSNLYVKLYSRCTSNDPENEELASTALKLLAIAHRPLGILELSWAVTLSTAQQVTTMDVLAELVDHERVMNLIRPFIVHVNSSDGKKRQVRLIHQSIKEFIMEKWTLFPHPRESDLTEPDQKVLNPRFKGAETFILDICIRYLLLDDIGNRNLFSDEQVAISELPQGGSDLFDDNDDSGEYTIYCSWEEWEEGMIRFDPTERGFGEFFVYAACYWLEHLAAVTVETLPDLTSVEKLCQTGSTRLYNWIEQHRRPGCAIVARFDVDLQSYDPLGIVSLYGSEDMLRYLLEKSNFDKDKFLGEPVMSAVDQILQWGDVSRLRILFFNDRVGPQLRNLDFFRLVIRRWHDSITSLRNWDPAFDLVNDVSNELVQQKWGNELMCVAARLGCMPIVQRLMASTHNSPELRNELLRESGFGQNRSEPTHLPIGEAILGDHLDVVEYLLGENDIEAHIRYRNSRGENVLHLASRVCNPEMFRLLVPHFKEGIHQVDHQGFTALVRIIKNYSVSRNRYESVKTLLQHGGGNPTGDVWTGQQNPLEVAVQLNDLDMCSLLIYVGKINPLSALTRGCEDQTDSKHSNPAKEDNLLHTLADLFDIKPALSKGNPEAFCHFAKKHYQIRFGN